MADRVLRDHSEPCEHAPDDNDTDEDQRHYRYLTGHHRANGEWCPGGREVTIDYEAAAEYLSKLIDASPDETWPGEFLPYAKVESRKILDAALGEAHREAG